MMRLAEVVARGAWLVRGSPETDISAVVVDSRRVVPGALFCALPGAAADGTAFIADALRRGAAAVLASSDVPEESLDGDYPLVLAVNPRTATALAAAAIHRFPAARMGLLGVTGTNGKTTVVSLVDAMVRAAGRRSGLVGTVEQRFGNVRRDASHTTPESVDLQALFAEMVEAGTELVAMEVSSHALAQSRVAGLRFRAAAFTQLTRDHLDYHGTLDRYFDAKASLFHEHLAADGVAVINGADPYGKRLAKSLTAAGRRVWRFGIEGADGLEDVPELFARDLRLSLAGFAATLATPMGTRPVRSPLVGRHNVENALAAAGLALAGGIPLGAVVDALATCSGAPGRLEPVADPSGRRVFVDYAHTDDALGRVLEALRAQAPADARVISVFGCGGDRDPGKRPLMGEAAARRSDVVVVTSDNPRSESPERIIEAVVPGVERGGLSPSDEPALAAGGRGFVTVVDRAEAIATALRIARPGDVVLIAGKGHETYQQVGSEKRPFDDREIAQGALRALSGERR